MLIPLEKRSQNIHYVALFGHIIVSVIDINKYEQETKDDLLTNKDYYFMDTEKLIVMSFVNMSNSFGFL